MTPPGPADDISGSGRGSMADSRTAYELKDIPLLKSVIGIYSRTKSSNAILTFGCSFAEKGVGIVVNTVVVTTGYGDLVDTVTSGLVSRVKDNCPFLQRTPEKIYKKTKFKASRYIRRRTNSALRTSVGQTVLSALDAITEISEEVYKFLNHYPILNREGNMKMEKHVQIDLISPTKSSRGQQTKLTGTDDQWVKQLTQEDKQIVEPVFSLSYIIMVPLELFTQFLRYLQAKLHALADTHSETRRSNRCKNGGHPITPDKIEEIVARRKVSPRKRINSSIIGNIKSVVYRMLGFDSSCVKQTDIRQFLSCSKHRPLNLSPVMSGDDTEKKRKHDNILTTEEESDDEDLVNMDLKNYISDEDPDYEPTDEEESDFSIDSNEEYDESDFETEDNEGLVMMKDKIYKKTKFRASRYIRRRTKSALRTSVGQTVLSALDAITEISEEVYTFLNHYTILNRDRNMKVPSKMEKHIQTDLISPTKSSRGQQTKLTGADDQWVKQLTQEDKQIVEPVFSLSYIIMVPLELFTQFLRYLQAKLHALADTHYETRRSNRRKNGGHPITPDKIEEIVARRKVSPRKRINSSIIRNFKSVVYRMLGFDSSCVKQTDIRQFLSCSKHRPLNLSPVMSGDDTEKKRKHDNILSTEEESDDEDLVNMDQKNYISDEDPDYEPTDNEESDISIDSNEEYDESDFETEENEGLVMMTDKENAKPVETKPKDTKPIELKPKETEKKPVIPLKENENLNAKTPPKKEVLSPKKHTNTNNQPALSLMNLQLKPFGGKEEKKDVNQKYGSYVDQVKKPEVVNKPSTTPNTGNVEKQHGNKKS